MKKTGETVMGVANSSLVKGASHVGTGVLKAGIEGVAGIADKAIKGAQRTAPKLKSISGKKISAGIGKAVNKTMVGVGDDYKTIGKAINSSKPGKAVNNMVGGNIIDDNAAVRFRGSLKKHGNRPKTTYVSSNQTFGLVDAVTDRAKTYVDGTIHVLKGDSWITGKQPLIKTGADNFMPFGIKATGLGTTLAVGGSLIGGTPQAVEQWNRNRQGTNMDSEPVSLAPRTPAYANNGGATGDLVFALNNLRHGGMM